MAIIRIDVPVESNAVHGTDGRVFVDMDYMLREWQPIGEAMPELSIVYILDAIRQSRESLAIEAAYLED